jgi:hypothetical protein
MVEEEKKEETIEESMKVINTLSELIFPPASQETERPEIEIAASVTEAQPEETENAIEDDEDVEEKTPAGPAENEADVDGNPDQDPDFSDPIDIVTENGEDFYSEPPEENEIPDDHDDLETEFIQHETEPLLQDIANQIMHLIEESTTVKEEEATTVRDREELEAEAEANQANHETQTEATEAEQATELIDVRVSETSEAENIESEQVEGSKNEHMEELTTVIADELNAAPTEKPVETESPPTEAAIPELLVADATTVMPVTVTAPAVDVTTQAIAELTSRTTVMEPNAEISTTIANFLHFSDDEATTVASLSSEATTKDTRRKFDDFKLKAFSAHHISFRFHRENPPRRPRQLGRFPRTLMPQRQAVSTGRSQHVLQRQSGLRVRVSAILGHLE